MDEHKLARLRDHYDNTDLSTEIDRAHWETDVEPDPMVTTSLRLPKSVLDWVREQAEVEHVKPTALIRRWIEQQRDAHIADVSGRLERLVSRLEVVVNASEAAPTTTKGAARRRRTRSAVIGAQKRRSGVSGRWVSRGRKFPEGKTVGDAEVTRGKRGSG